MPNWVARLILAIGLTLTGVGLVAVIPGGGDISEEPRSLMGSGFVNPWADVGPQTWSWSDWLSLRVDAPADTTVVIWNHGTEAMLDAPSCLGEGYFPPPAVIRLERLPGVRVYYLCTKADQRDGPQAYFEARRREILALGAELREAGVPAGQIFLAGQSGGATAAALALAAEPDRFGGGLLFAMAWRGRGEALRRRVLAKPHDVWVRETLTGAERLEALIVAFTEDQWNGPEDLVFLEAAHPATVTLFSPACGAGHSGAYHGCGVEFTARAASDWLSARLPRP